MAKTLKTAICVLCEDELDLILNKVGDPDDRKSFSEVCKLWYKVESLNRSSIRLLGPDFPRQVVSRFPNLVTFETHYYMTDDDLVFLGQTCPKLEVVSLGSAYRFWDKASDLVGGGVVGLLSLAKGCVKLSKVILEGWRIIDSLPPALISLAPNLKHLDLGRCRNVSDDTLEAIGSSSSITYLNLRGCYQPIITDKGLGFLGNGSISKTLQTLILDLIYSITDVGVPHLKKMRYLEYLSLVECSNITDIGGAAISAIPTLKELNLTALPQVSDRTMVALAQNLPNLEILNVSRCGGITGAGIRAFSGHIGLETIVLRYCQVEASDLEDLVLRCGSLKSIVLDTKLYDRIWPRMQEQFRRFVTIEGFLQWREIYRS